MGMTASWKYYGNDDCTALSFLFVKNKKGGEKGRVFVSVASVLASGSTSVLLSASKGFLDISTGGDSKHQVYTVSPHYLS